MIITLTHKLLQIQVEPPQQLQELFNKWRWKLFFVRDLSFIIHIYFLQIVHPCVTTLKRQNRWTDRLAYNSVSIPSSLRLWWFWVVLAWVQPTRILRVLQISDRRLQSMGSGRPRWAAGESNLTEIGDGSEYPRIQSFIRKSRTLSLAISVNQVFTWQREISCHSNSHLIYFPLYSLLKEGQ